LRRGWDRGQRHGADRSAGKKRTGGWSDHGDGSFGQHQALDNGAIILSRAQQFRPNARGNGLGQNGQSPVLALKQ
jgi:hypothetical protein